jgi:hypothetical protein
MSAKLKQHHRRQNSIPNSNHPKNFVSNIVLKGTASSAAIPITKTPDYIERLKSLIHSEEVLVSAGYIMEELPHEALEMKKICSGCSKRMLLSNPLVTFLSSILSLAMSRFMPKNKKKQTHAQENLGHARNDSLSLVDTTDALRNTESPSRVEPRMCCKFHSGQLITKVCV